MRERLLRVTGVLNQAGIPYAVVGGHAVASWVTAVDEGAARNTPTSTCSFGADVPIITAALLRAGFLRTQVGDVTAFLDGPDAEPSESIHLVFAGERFRPEYPLPSPNLSTIDDPAGFRVITLEGLVRMKLLSNRDKDRAHVRDLVGVCLVDRSWLAKLPPLLAERLKGILDTPFEMRKRPPGNPSMLSQALSVRNPASTGRRTPASYRRAASPGCSTWRSGVRWQPGTIRML